MTHVTYGRCRSGKRWFWFAGRLDSARYGEPRHKCDDPVCHGGYGYDRHLYGWEDTEELALKTMGEAVSELGGEVKPHSDGRAPGWAGTASGALKRINEAKRRARPPSGNTDASVTEYLYEAHVWRPEDGPEVRRVRKWAIARKTGKRIYFADGAYVSREDLETDTRCRARCPRGIPAGPVCAPHGRGFRHCVHFGQDSRSQSPRCWVPPGCGEDCPIDTPGLQCAEHGYAWDHCLHGEDPCRHGYPAGELLKHGQGWWDSAHLFATRVAAEEYLHGGDRERERQRQEAEPEIKRLRREMAAVHPDRGGTNEEFIAARKRYERALRRAS